IRVSCAWGALTVAVAVATSSPVAHAALSTTESRCRQAVGAGGRVFLKNVQKALARCRDKVSKGSLPAMTDCTVEPGTASRIAKDETRLGAKVAGSCTDATVAQLVFGGTCYGTATVADLVACLADTHEEQA